MNKYIKAVLTLNILILISACNIQKESTELESFIDNVHEIGSTITIPQDIVARLSIETNEESLNKLAKDNNFIYIEQNEDGSLTYAMSIERFIELLDYYNGIVENTLEEIIKDDNNYIYDIANNDNKFIFYILSNDIKKETLEAFKKLEDAYFLYSVYCGNPYNKLTVDFMNQDDELISTITSD